MTGRVYVRRPLAERILSRVEVTPGPMESACWVWQGARSPAGYGKLSRLQVHRALYEALVGPIPKGLQIDHLCRVRSCCNPDHLEPVTARENGLRGTGHCAVNASKTRCIHGHEFTPENTYIGNDGWRRCRTCIVARGKREAAARKAARHERGLLRKRAA